MEVELSGVSKSFGRVRALAGVDALLRGPGLVRIEGANGSGKSTLLSLIGTLTVPTSGEVIHRGFGATRTKIRERLGWLTHDTLTYLDLTGRENLELAAALYADAESTPDDRSSKVGAAIARFEIGAFGDRHVRTYSRGQRQRLALARALVGAPQLLLLDEPTTGLDQASMQMLEKTIAEEIERGALVILVTHDRAFARAIAGETIKLERGRRPPPLPPGEGSG